MRHSASCWAARIIWYGMCALGYSVGTAVLGMSLYGWFLIFAEDWWVVGMFFGTILVLAAATVFLFCSLNLVEWAERKVKNC